MCNCVIKKVREVKEKVLRNFVCSSQKVTAKALRLMDNRWAVLIANYYPIDNTWSGIQDGAKSRGKKWSDAFKTWLLFSPLTHQLSLTVSVKVVLVVR